MDLSRFDNSWYDPGAPLLKRVAWYVCNALLFDSWWVPMSAPKRVLLRWFGADVGVGVVIKPRVNIKYPWRLRIGDASWIGEGVWIDNLADVVIESNVCISQGAYLLTGNHDYRDETFGLMIAPICIRESAWVAAGAVICPGVTLGPASVIGVRSVVQRDADGGWVYLGVPAEKRRRRFPSDAGRLERAFQRQLKPV